VGAGQGWIGRNSKGFQKGVDVEVGFSNCKAKNMCGLLSIIVAAQRESTREGSV
jgi:hypothetical protein